MVTAAQLGLESRMRAGFLEVRTVDEGNELRNVLGMHGGRTRCRSEESAFRYDGKNGSQFRTIWFTGDDGLVHCIPSAPLDALAHAGKQESEANIPEQKTDCPAQEWQVAKPNLDVCVEDNGGDGILWMSEKAHTQDLSDRIEKNTNRAQSGKRTYRLCKMKRERLQRVAKKLVARDDACVEELMAPEVPMEIQTNDFFMGKLRTKVQQMLSDKVPMLAQSSEASRSVGFRADQQPQHQRMKGKQQQQRRLQQQYQGALDARLMQVGHHSSRALERSQRITHRY